jgi:hypothetical protein
MFVALDISTKTGFAIFSDKSLINYGTIFQEKSPLQFGPYPIGFVLFAEKVSQDVLSLVQGSGAKEVVIEETNASRQNYSQKILEFIHFAVVKALHSNDIKINYVRTGVWRQITDSNQSSEEKKLNAKISRIKKKTGKKIAKIDGKVVGKKTRKHSSLRSFASHFGIELKRKEEDAAEAALLGLAFIRNAPVCDGTIKGGILKGKK